MVKVNKVLRISQDDFGDDSPLDWSEIVEVWYRSDSRYILGNHPVSDFGAELLSLLRDCKPSVEQSRLAAEEAFGSTEKVEKFARQMGWLEDDDAVIDDLDEDDFLDMIEEGYNYGWNGHYCVSDETLIAMIEDTGKAVLLPAYAYIHGDVALSLGSFSCPWDSGQFGFVVIRPSDVQKEWNGDLGKAENYAKAVFGQFAQYVAGEVYCLLVEDEDGNTIDSLCGVYFDDDKSPCNDDDVIEMAKIADVLDADDDGDNVTVETSW